MATDENPFNPYDQTIQDPTNPEFAIEDPMHGPSAILAMSQTPPMPRGDGTYYQAGAYSTIGTAIFDALGGPISGYPSAASTAESMREVLRLSEWVIASHEGEEALKALETRRQQQRLDQKGYAQSFKPSDICAGGERLDECETAIPLIAAAQEYIATRQAEANNHHTGWNVLSWLGKTCANCQLACQTSIETKDGIPTGITRFTNYRPLEDVPTLHIEL